MEMQALMAAATEAHRDQQSQVEIRSKAMSSNRLKELLIQQQTTNEYSAAAICSSSTHWVLHKLNPPRDVKGCRDMSCEIITILSQ